MYNRPIVPLDFKVPVELRTHRMKLRPLTLQDVDKDYEAVMSSSNRLRTLFNPDRDWPEGLTLEQNTIELGWHQVEFQLRTSFAYTVVSLDESRILGCTYIYPAIKSDYDVEVTMWVRESEADTGLDEHLFEAVYDWITQVWPFKNPAFPGRKITREDWNSL
jgi:hypothetical protein